MNVELNPPQPPSVEDAVAALLEAAAPPGPDPWWEAGHYEALET